MHEGASFTRWQSPDGPAALRPLAWLLAALDLAAAWLLCVLLGAMVVVVAAQVAMRYGFNSSIDWADEISRLCFVWSIFLAIALGVKTGAHIGVDFLVARCPAWLRAVLARAVALVCAAALGLVAWESFTVARDQWDELMGSVNRSAGWFLVPLVVCGLHGGLHMLWIALNGPAAAAPSVLEELN